MPSGTPRTILISCKSTISSLIPFFFLLMFCVSGDIYGPGQAVGQSAQNAEKAALETPAANNTPAASRKTTTKGKRAAQTATKYVGSFYSIPSFRLAERSVRRKGEEAFAADKAAGKIDGNRNFAAFWQYLGSDERKEVRLINSRIFAAHQTF